MTMLASREKRSRAHKVWFQDTQAVVQQNEGRLSSLRGTEVDQDLFSSIRDVSDFQFAPIDSPQTEEGLLSLDGIWSSLHYVPSTPRVPVTDKIHIDRRPDFSVIPGHDWLLEHLIPHNLFRANSHKAAILDRLSFLREEAEEEKQAYSQASADHLISVCDEIAADIRPAIVLLENGNLRAVWQKRPTDQIGIQFFPNGDLQFVILHDHKGTLLKTMGVELIETIRRHVRAVGISHLWYHG